MDNRGNMPPIEAIDPVLLAISNDKPSIFGNKRPGGGSTSIAAREESPSVEWSVGSDGSSSDDDEMEEQNELDKYPEPQPASMTAPYFVDWRSVSRVAPSPPAQVVTPRARGPSSSSRRSTTERSPFAVPLLDTDNTSDDDDWESSFAPHTPSTRGRTLPSSSPLKTPPAPLQTNPPFLLPATTNMNDDAELRAVQPVLNQPNYRQTARPGTLSNNTIERAHPTAPPVNAQLPTVDISDSEILHYFPLSIRRNDVMWRLIRNGATPPMIHELWTAARTMANYITTPTPATLASREMLRRAISDQTRIAGGAQTNDPRWTLTRQRIHMAPLTPCPHSSGAAFQLSVLESEDMEIAQLARGLRMWPHPQDQGAVTRAVRYAIKNVDEKWLVSQMETLLEFMDELDREEEEEWVQKELEEDSSDHLSDDDDDDDDEEPRET